MTARFIQIIPSITTFWNIVRYEYVRHGSITFPPFDLMFIVILIVIPDDGKMEDLSLMSFVLCVSQCYACSSKDFNLVPVIISS